MTTKTLPTPSLADVEARATAAAEHAATELPVLQARRQTLALEALRDPKAAEELERVEHEIYAVSTAAERAQLAVKEQVARDDAAAQLAANEQRRDQEAALADAETVLHGTLADVDTALAGLVDRIQAATAAHRTAYSLAHDISDQAREKVGWHQKRILARRVLTALGPLLAPELGHTRTEYRVNSLTPERSATS